jgi:CubicO group peptidase (beta-lactamase class C family)
MRTRHLALWAVCFNVAGAHGCTGNASTAFADPGGGDSGAMSIRSYEEAGAPPSRASAVPQCATDLRPDLRTLGVPGLSAAIVKGDHVACYAVAGLADTTRGTAVGPDTSFLWASVSKTVTATALMQLFDAGKFALDDDIDEHLPFSVRNPACPGTPITFRQLLNHTSSIVDNDASIGNDVDNSVPGDSPVLLADFTRAYLTPGGRLFDRAKNFGTRCPGMAAEYSNMGITLVGYLIEVISGSSFHAYVADHVFGPLEMPESAFRLAGLDASRIALPNGDRPHYGEPDFPDGMMRTTPSLLGHFLIMYMQDGIYRGKRILRSSTVHEILENQSSLGSPSGAGITQGLVWYTVDSFGPVTWGHNGSDNGASSDMFFDPVTKSGVLFVANGEWSGDPGAVSSISELFREAATYER